MFLSMMETVHAYNELSHIHSRWEMSSWNEEASMCSDAQHSHRDRINVHVTWIQAIYSHVLIPRAPPATMCLQTHTFSQPLTRTRRRDCRMSACNDILVSGITRILALSITTNHTVTHTHAMHLERQLYTCSSHKYSYVLHRTRWR